MKNKIKKENLLNEI